MSSTKLGDTVATRFETETLDALDAYRRGLPVEPSRSALIRKIVANWVEEQRGQQLTATTTAKPRAASRGGRGRQPMPDDGDER